MRQGVFLGNFTTFKCLEQGLIKGNHTLLTRTFHEVFQLVDIPFQDQIGRKRRIQQDFNHGLSPTPIRAPNQLRRLRILGTKTELLVEGEDGSWLEKPSMLGLPIYSRALGEPIKNAVLEPGAKVNETDDRGKTALDHATAGRDRSDDPGTIQAFGPVIELLQKRGGRRGVDL